MALELFKMLMKNTSVWFKGGLKFVSNNCNVAYEHNLDGFKNFEMFIVFQKCFSRIRCQREYSIYEHLKNASDCLTNFSLLLLSQTSSCINTPAVTSRIFFLLTPPMRIVQCVPKRRHIKLSRRGTPKRKDTTFRTWRKFEIKSNTSFLNILM